MISSHAVAGPGAGMPWSDLKRTTRWATFPPMTQAAVPRQRIDEPLEQASGLSLRRSKVESSREPIGLVARLERLIVVRVEGRQHVQPFVVVLEAVDVAGQGP